MTELCTYCDSPATTRDHVPPKAVFPKKPRPQNLITVPSCEDCNTKFGEDDELFSLFITLQAGMEGEQEHKLCEKVKRAVKRNTTFQKILLSSSENIPLFNKDGTIQEYIQLLPWEYDHLERILNRIVVGLLRHHYGQRLYRQGYCKIIIPQKDFSNVYELRDILKDCVFSEIGHQKEFCYRHGQAKDHRLATFWEIIFYRKFLFYGITLPLII
jgi:hypothetical protein